MKTIPFVKKQTGASTQYNQITSSDLNWLLSQSKRLVDVANDCANSGVKEGQALNQPNPNLPRQSSGTRNSPKSMCDGINDNFNKGQYDLSSKQMDGLVESFRIGESVIDNFDSIEFNEVDKLPKIKSAVTSQVDELDPLLFQIDSVTITYTRSQME
jgi:hypothetical protein